MRASFPSLRKAQYAASVAVLLCIAACTFLPHSHYRAFPNVAVEQGTSSTPPPIDRLAVSEQLVNGFPGDRSVFVGIAASGGGSRAAVFTAAVMEQLEQLGFMREVRAISSVSGAGLPSAYYAIHGAKLEAGNRKDWESFHEAMAEDFRSALVAKALNPVNLALTAFTTMDRSDLLADVFDDRLFGSSTFGDLAKIPLAPRHPLWFASATDTTAGGRRFVFEAQTFRGLNSDLRKLKISRAVGASAAFPGLLNSVTLAEFDRKTSAPSSFLHIIDGGTSDNLGIETLLDVAYRFGKTHPDWRPADEPQTKPPFACFLFLVDAFAPYRDKEASKDPEARRSSLSYFVDLNFLSGFDALLANRRRTQLDLLGFPVTQPSPPSYDGLPSRSNLDWVDTSRSVFVGRPPSSSTEFGYLRVQNVPIGNLRADQPQPRPKLDTRESTKIGESQLSCVVWHISLSGVRSLMQTAGSLDSKGYEGVMGRTAVRWSPNTPVQKYRREIWDVITQVPTDFNLNGPDACTKQDIGAAIRTAARIAVREDPEAGRVACEWFRQNFPGQQFACDSLTADKYATGRGDPHGAYSATSVCGSE